MNVSIIRDFDKLEGTCSLCKYVWAGKNDLSVPDQYNQMSVRVGGFQAPFVTLPEG